MIAGIGEGVWLILIILVLSFAVCFLTNHTNLPGICCVVTIIVITLIVAFLSALALPADYTGPDPNEKYDPDYIKRIIITLALAAFGLVAVFTMLANFIFAEMQGRRVANPVAPPSLLTTDPSEILRTV